MPTRKAYSENSAAILLYLGNSGADRASPLGVPVNVARRATARFDGLSMNLLTREVTRADHEIELRSREFALLELLMPHCQSERNLRVA